MPEARPLALASLMLLGAGCAADRSDEPTPSSAEAPAMTDADAPPAIRAWMDRLTVSHHYDPATGFIVADETIPLPGVIAEAPPLDAAVADARRRGVPVLAFATADRCAPCQQFKKDALNDPEVIQRLAGADFLVAHVEVDERPDLARGYLGGGAIPMTYVLRDGEITATLRGQRSAADLLAFIDEHLGA